MKNKRIKPICCWQLNQWKVISSIIYWIFTVHYVLMSVLIDQTSQLFTCHLENDINISQNLTFIGECERAVMFFGGFLPYWCVCLFVCCVKHLMNPWVDCNETIRLPLDAPLWVNPIPNSCQNHECTERAWIRS